MSNRVARGAESAGGGGSPSTLARAGLLSLVVTLVAIASTGSLPAGAEVLRRSDDTAVSWEPAPRRGEARSSASNAESPGASPLDARIAAQPYQGLFASSTGLTFVSVPGWSSTTATLRVRLAGSTSTARTLHVRYQESSTYPGGAWTTTTHTLAANKTEVDVKITGLDYGTGYRAEVSLDNNFTTVIFTTFTTRSAPTPTWVGMLNITGTTAIAYVTYSGVGPATVYARYKKATEANWNSTTFEAVTRGPGNVYVPVAMTGLEASTEYKVEVSFDDTDWSPSVEKTFTTKSASYSLPTVTSVSGGQITACTARIYMTFPNSGRNSFLIYFRWKRNVESANWSRVEYYPTASTGASSQVGLRPSTTYIAQASFDPDFSSGLVESAPFTTTSSPYVSNVVADPVGATTATLTATRSNFCVSFPTYHFRYRVKGTQTWTTTAAPDQRRVVNLTGLTPSTTYEVEVSFHTDFSHLYKIEFRTLPLVPDPPVPRLVAINLEDVVRTSATVVAEVADAEADTEAHLLYQNLRSDTFSTSQTATVANSEARFPISGLVSGTRYRLWASLDQTLLTDTLTPATKPDDVLSAEFTTIPPGVLGVAAQTIGQTKARLTVTIAEPNGLDQSVYTQFRTTDPEGNWVAAGDTPTTKIDTAIVDLTGLTSDTEYEARASLDSTFPDDETETSNAFRTWPPGVDGLSVKDVTQSGATIVVSLSAANGSILYLIYRPVGGTWAGAQQPVAERQTSVEFPLTGLMSGTEYEVRISYDSRLHDLVGQNTPRSLGSRSTRTTRGVSLRSVPRNQESETKDEPVSFNGLTFQTLPPSVVGVEVGDATVGQTEATVSVTVKEPNGTAQVHVRYSTDDTFPDTAATTKVAKVAPTTTNSDGEDTVAFELTGLAAGTTYHVEASFDSSFPDTDATQSTSFTTDPPEPAVSSVEVLDSGSNLISQTAATVRVNVSNPDGSDDVHIRYSTDSGFAQGSTIVTDSATPGTSDAYEDFALSGLSSHTTYHVQASFDNSFPAGSETKSASFVTDPPLITDVSASGVTKTGVTATVTVDKPNDDPVYLHYRAGDSSWVTIDPAVSSSSYTLVVDPAAGTYAFALAGLTSGTAYTAYASFDSTPPSSGATLAAAQTATFTTLDAGFVSVVASGVDQTEATVTVTVDVAASKAVQLHYRKDSVSSWSGPMSANVTLDTDTNTHTVEFALSGLTSGTEYVVYASFDSTAPASGTTLDDKQTAEFTTDPPRVDKVEVTAKTDTTAEVTVTILEPNGESQTVMVRYQTTPSGNWVTVQPDPATATATVVVDLSSLAAVTQYKVDATTAASFTDGVKSTIFTTDSPDPGVSDVEMSGESQTGARATITIANAGTTVRTAYLRYRESGSDTWSDPPEQGDSTTAAPGTAVIDLSGLGSGAQYEVQASLDSNFASGVQSATFSTLPPEATAVDVLEEHPTTAKVRVTVGAPNGKSTLFLRYGSGGDWTRDFASDVDMEEVEFTLTGLEPDSTYSVEASFDSGFAGDATATATVETPQFDAPTIDVPDPGRTTADVDITVTSPDHQNGVVYVRFQVTPSGGWSSVRAAVVTAGSARATLSGLTSETEYRVEASLSRSFPANATGSRTFTTDPPGVDTVEVTGRTATTAEITVTISAPNGQSQTVYLEYDTTANADQGNWGNDEDESTSTGTAVIDLSGLSAGTQYTVRASLTSDFSGETRAATFTTTSNSPHVSDVEVADAGIGQTTATAAVSIANVTAATDVFLRFRIAPSGTWSDPVLEAASTAGDPGAATKQLTGLTSGTHYQVQASLDSTFGTGVQSTTFATDPPAVSSVTASGETASGATITVAVSAPNGKPVFLRYRTGTGNWIERYKTVAETATSVAFILSGLRSSSTYTVQASYDISFPDTDAAKTATFTTQRSPSSGTPGGSAPPNPSTPPGSDPPGGLDPIGSNNQPSFSEGSRTLRSVAENTPAGEKVGAPVPVNDDDGDELSFTIVQSPDSWRFDVTAVSSAIRPGFARVVAGTSDLVVADFDVVDDVIANSVQILTRTRLDYETKNVYRLTISVADGIDGNGEADGSADASILVTVLVTDLEEEGTITLSAATPRVRTPLTASLTDPDEGIAGIQWTWERSQNQTEWTIIEDATGRTYTPTTGDEGHYLRVTANYTDRRGPDKVATAEPPKPVRVGYDQDFADLDDATEHAEAIRSLAADGVFVDTECDDQLFCPHLPLTRWAMAVWLLRVLVDRPETVIGTSRFQDIEDGNWWIRYVEHLYDRKITIGCSETPLRYCPDRAVTRAQMASFLVRALKLPAAQPAGFTDTHRTVHADDIDALYAAGITVGCAEEPLQYCPEDSVTRAQMATFLYRMAPWVDRYALTALYNDTNGPDWANNTNWATDRPLDQWYGVQTDHDGAVTALHLAGNRLHGPIPHALANLTHLQTLQLSANVLTGCIPTPLHDIPNNDLNKLGLPNCT